MGYLQATTGITTNGPGSTLSFSTPICAAVSLQQGGTGSAIVVLEATVDGANFTPITLGGGAIHSNANPPIPISAIRYNVSNISGTITVAIAAAIPGAA